MQRYSDKGIDETRLYTVAFSRNMNTGATISSAEVTCVVNDNSDVDDPDSEDMIDNDPIINTNPITVNDETIPALQAVTQSIKDGVEDCDYVLKFKATISTGEILYEDVLIRVRKFVPTP